MIQFFTLYFLLLTLFSCANHSFKQETYNVKITADKQQNLEILTEDIKYLHSTGLIDEFSFLNQLKIINSANNNCSLEQVACAFPNKKNSIFISEYYYKLDQIERVITLIHEMSHHVYGYDHVSCLSKEISNTSCDDNIKSPFGSEFKAIQFLQNKKYLSDLSANKKLRAISHRVNSLIKSK